MMRASGLSHFLGNKNSFKTSNHSGCSPKSFFNQTLFGKTQITQTNGYHTTSILQEKNTPNNSKEKTVVILGGGISGISFAYYLLRESLETGKRVKVILIEKNGRVGGWLETKRTPYGVIEGGARRIFAKTNCKNLLRVVQDVGLNDQIVVSENHNVPTYLLHDKRFIKLPSTLKEVLKFPLIPPLSKLSMIFKQIFFKYRFKEDTNVQEFFRKQTCDEYEKYIVAPDVLLRHFGDTKQHSIRSYSRETFNGCNQHGTVLFAMAQERRLNTGRKMANRYARIKRTQAIALKSYLHNYSEKQDEADFEEAFISASESMEVLKYHPNLALIANSAYFSFRNGISSLPEAITQYLLENFPDQFDIHKKQKVIGFDCNKDEKYVKVITKDKENNRTIIDCDFIVSAIPAFELSKLIEPHSGKIKRLLNMIPFNPIGVANIGYDHIIDPPIPGSGFVVPSEFDHGIIGCHFDSQLFKTQNGNDSYSKYTILFGGPMDSPNRKALMHYALDKSFDPAANMKELMKSYFRIDREPGVLHLQVRAKAIPQYQVGHDDLVEAIQNNLKKEFSYDDKQRISVIGNSYYGNTIVDLFNDTKYRAMDFAAKLL